MFCRREEAEPWRRVGGQGREEGTQGRGKVEREERVEEGKEGRGRGRKEGRMGRGNPQKT